MKATITAGIIIMFIFLILPHVDALSPTPSWETSCANSTYIEKVAKYQYNGTFYNFTTTLKCNYGCDTERNICWQWPAYAIPGEYYFLFEVFGLVLLMFILYRLDVNQEEIRIFDVVIPVMLVMIFSVLALQGNNVIDMTTGEGVRIIFLVWFNFGLAVFSLIPFFFSLFKYIHSAVEGGAV